jgi:hypothetical protein
MSTVAFNNVWTATNHNTYVTLARGGGAGLAGAGDCVIAVIGTKSSVSVTAADVDGKNMVVDSLGVDTENSRNWYICRAASIESDPSTITIHMSGTDTDAYSLAWAVNSKMQSQAPFHFELVDNVLEGLDEQGWHNWVPLHGYGDGVIGIEWLVTTFVQGAPGSTVWTKGTITWDDQGTSTVTT